MIERQTPSCNNVSTVCLLILAEGQAELVTGGRKWVDRKGEEEMNECGHTHIYIYIYLKH